MGGPFDGRAVLTGAGESQVGRRLGRTGLDLTLEAVLRDRQAAATPEEVAVGVGGGPVAGSMLLSSR